MYILNSNDNRLVTCSLEVLQVLFKFLPFKFDVFLTSIGSMDDSYLIKKQLNFSPLKQNSMKIPTQADNTEEQKPEEASIPLIHRQPVVSPSHLIGQFYSKLNSPIEYFVRCMAFKFLLNIENFETSKYEAGVSFHSSVEFKLKKLKHDSQVKVR